MPCGNKIQETEKDNTRYFSREMPGVFCGYAEGRGMGKNRNIMEIAHCTALKMPMKCGFGGEDKNR